MLTLKLTLMTTFNLYNNKNNNKHIYLLERFSFLQFWHRMSLTLVKLRMKSTKNIAPSVDFLSFISFRFGSVWFGFFLLYLVPFQAFYYRPLHLR